MERELNSLPRSHSALQSGKLSRNIGCRLKISLAGRTFAARGGRARARGEGARHERLAGPRN